MSLQYIVPGEPIRLGHDFLNGDTSVVLAARQGNALLARAASQGISSVSSDNQILAVLFPAENYDVYGSLAHYDNGNIIAITGITSDVLTVTVLSSPTVRIPANGFVEFNVSWVSANQIEVNGGSGSSFDGTGNGSLLTISAGRTLEVARDMAVRIKDRVNVLDFGTNVGTGSDDTTAILAAVAQYTEIWFPARATPYQLEADQLIFNNPTQATPVHLYGARGSAITITGTGTAGIKMVNAPHCSISNLYIKANTAGAVRHAVLVTAAPTGGAYGAQGTQLARLVNCTADSFVDGFGVATECDSVLDVSETLFDSCNGFGNSNSAFYLGWDTYAPSNVLNVFFRGCQTRGGAYGVYSSGVNYSWDHGTTSGHTTCSFRNTKPGGGPYFIKGVRDEGSFKLLEHCLNWSDVAFASVTLEDAMACFVGDYVVDIRNGLSNRLINCNFFRSLVGYPDSDTNPTQIAFGMAANDPPYTPGSVIIENLTTDNPGSPFLQYGNFVDLKASNVHSVVSEALATTGFDNVLTRAYRFTEYAYGSTDWAIQFNDRTLFVDNSGGAITLTLPDVTKVIPGWSIRINVLGSAHAVTLSEFTTGQTIDGSSTSTLAQGMSEIFATGSNSTGSLWVTLPSAANLAHLSGTETLSGAKTFSATATFSSYVNVGTALQMFDAGSGNAAINVTNVLTLDAAVTLIRSADTSVTFADIRSTGVTVGTLIATQITPALPTAITPSAGTATINAAASNSFTMTLAANTAITITNFNAQTRIRILGAGYTISSFTITNPASGSVTPTYSGGSIPVLTGGGHADWLVLQPVTATTCDVFLGAQNL